MILKVMASAMLGRSHPVSLSLPHVYKRYVYVLVTSDSLRPMD